MNSFTLPDYKDPEYVLPDGERFKRVLSERFPSDYSVSDRGRFYSHRFNRQANDRMRGSSFGRAVADLFVDGRTEDRDFVLHVNGDRHDHRASNLRWVPKAITLMTRPVGATGYTGVRPCHRSKKFVALMAVKGDRQILGRYDTPRAAGIVFARAARDQYGGDCLPRHLQKLLAEAQAEDEAQAEVVQ